MVSLRTLCKVESLSFFYLLAVALPLCVVGGDVASSDCASSNEQVRKIKLKRIFSYYFSSTLSFQCRLQYSEVRLFFVVAGLHLQERSL